MSPVHRPRASPQDDEYAALLRQIRLGECAEFRARSTYLQIIAVELRATAQRLIRDSATLRTREGAPWRLGGTWRSF